MARVKIFAIALAVLLVGGLAGAGWVYSQRRDAPPLGPVASGTSSAILHPPARRDRRLGGLDATFIVYSDTHFGYASEETDLIGRPRDPVKDPKGTDVVNTRAIADMNAMPGRAWPRELGGSIDTPRGLIITGDLTEEGKPWQWRNFVAYYGLRGGDGLVRWPVFEAHGNHDKHHSWYVLDRVRERHGGPRYCYAFDWDDLHLVSLGEAPDDKDLDWLEKDLAAVGRERPVVIYQHFPLQGPYSEDNWYGKGDYRNRFENVIRGYNVVAFFHGHYHASGHYKWRGLSVFNVGAAKHNRHSFAVVRITDDRVRVASWHFDHDHWEWWREKPINGAKGNDRYGGERSDWCLMFGPY
jgi:cytolysin (calcineurin-like family phosphatase)